MAKDLWQYNSIQFPRLIAEAEAAGAFAAVWDELKESMDLEDDDLAELIDRAQEEWEAIKNMHCPPKVLDLSTE